MKLQLEVDLSNLEVVIRVRVISESPKGSCTIAKWIELTKSDLRADQWNQSQFTIICNIGAEYYKEQWTHWSWRKASFLSTDRAFEHRPWASSHPGSRALEQTQREYLFHSQSPKNCSPRKAICFRARSRDSSTLTASHFTISTPISKCGHSD